MEIFRGFTNLNAIPWRRFRALLMPALLWPGCACLGASSLVYDFALQTPGTNTREILFQARFQDVAPDTVLMSLEGLPSDGEANLRRLWLNLDPVFDPSNLVFTRLCGIGDFLDPIIRSGPDSFRAGGGRYDLLFQFRGGRRDIGSFDAGDGISFLITGVPGLTSSSFNFMGASRGFATGPFHAVAGIGGAGLCEELGRFIPAEGCASVPEPALFPVTLLILVAAGLLKQPRRKTANQRQ